MEKKQLLIVIGIFIIAIVIAGVLFFIEKPTEPGKYDTFATCLKERGAIFYGAFWCPHCRDQKTMFGKSASLLPYVECSTPDGNGILAVCREKNIESYPTWDFADGSRQTGVIPLEMLAEKTACELPQ